MANAQAFQLGWESGSELAAHRRERKEQLQDEERQLRVTDLFTKGNQLSRIIPSLTGDEQTKAKDALAGIERDIALTYHPEHNPGALQKDWHWLSHLIGMKGKPAPPVLETRTEPGLPSTRIAMPTQDQTIDLGGGKRLTIPSALTAVNPMAPDLPASKVISINRNAMTPQQRQRAQQWAGARQRAETDVMAAGLSPEQQAQVEARTTGTKALALAQNARATYQQTGLPPEGEENFVRQTLEDAYGIKTPASAQKWERVKAHVNGMPEDLLFYQGAYYYNDGTPLSPEESRGAKVDPKPTAGAKGLKFDKVTGQVVDPETGRRYNPGDPLNPADVRAMFAGADKTLAATRDFQAKLVGLRGASYNASRPLASFDSWNGNAPTYATYGDYLKQPGRYIPAGPGDKAIARENSMQDIAGTSQLTRDAINNMQEDFPADMKAKIALSMKADDPHAAIDQLLASGALGTLSDDQQDFLIATRQLAENAMAMRGILGAGQGSEDVRSAIRETLPTLLSPDKSFALRQLDAFDKTIARLHRGVPRVPLNPTPFPPAGGAAPTGAGASPKGGAAPRAGAAAGAGAKPTRSIALFKTLWQVQNPGKTMSDEQARRIIINLGFTPIP